VRGSLDDLDATSVAVLEDKAREEGWTIGTRVPVRFADTGAKELTVKVIYRNKDLAKRYWVDNAVFDANVRSELDTAVLVKLAHGVSIDQARPAIAKVAKTFANVKVQDREQFIKAQSSQINQLLAFIYVLLFLALIIALFGITNTLVLSVVERTRELGLLRAVGMTRSQLRTMIRWEAVLIALFGTVGGLGVGIFFGWAFIHALADEGFHTFKVPVAQLAIICILAAFFGVVAALLPARRAARLNVLDAIATN
jgi:putative ABC transport system permease protein